MKLALTVIVCALSLCLAIEMPNYEVIQQLGNNMEIRKVNTIFKLDIINIYS